LSTSLFKILLKGKRTSRGFLPCFWSRCFWPWACSVDWREILADLR